MAAAKVAVRASLTAGCWAEMELRENGQGFNAGEDKRKNKETLIAIKKNQEDSGILSKPPLL